MPEQDSIIQDAVETWNAGGSAPILFQVVAARTVYDFIEIIYNEFKSIIKQNIVTETFLPFKKNTESDLASRNIDFIFEPDSKNILFELIPKELNIMFWKALLESNASEQGARMTAMETASNNAGDVIKELNLNYNRARQESITTELLEIVSGAEALQKG